MKHGNHWFWNREAPPLAHLAGHARRHAEALGFAPGRHGGGPTPPPPGWNPFGPGNPFFGGPGGPFGGGKHRRGGWWGGFGRGPRARRGDVRAAALVLLAEQARNGYQIIQEIAERSNGLWRPSSGAVYPALQQLEDEGLVQVQTQEGSRLFQLTDAGRAYVESHKDELAAPWDAVTAGVDDSAIGLHQLLGQVAMAVMQVSQAATPAQLAQAKQVLTSARRSLYQILAQDDAQDDGADEEGSVSPQAPMA